MTKSAPARMILAVKRARLRAQSEIAKAYDDWKPAHRDKHSLLPRHMALAVCKTLRDVELEDPENLVRSPFALRFYSWEELLIEKAYDAMEATTYILQSSGDSNRIAEAKDYTVEARKSYLSAYSRWPNPHNTPSLLASKYTVEARQTNHEAILRKAHVKPPEPSGVVMTKLRLIKEYREAYEHGAVETSVLTLANLRLAAQELVLSGEFQGGNAAVQADLLNELLLTAIPSGLPDVSEPESGMELPNNLGIADLLWREYHAARGLWSDTERLVSYARNDGPWFRPGGEERGST